MFGKRETEVLVAGAGPVGLCTGLLLAERGLDFQIVDSQWRTGSRSYALALHPRTVELFDSLGLAGKIYAAGHRVDAVAFYQGSERLGEIRLSELPGKHPYLLIMPQTALEETLEAELAARKHKVRWSHRLGRLESEGAPPVVMRIDRLGKDSTGYGTAETGWVIDGSETLRAGLVIGADGHRSLVRKALEIDYPVVGEAELFAVFEIETDGEAWNEARVIFGPGGTTNVVWPLGGGRFRWSFQVLGAEGEEVPRVKSRLAVSIGEDRYPFLGEEILHEMLAERAPFFDAAVKEVIWSVGVRFEKRLAESFGQGRSWLVGDAAHLAGPVGMHSMNVGMAEAQRLVDLAAEILHEGGGEEAFETWAAGRHQEWRQLLGVEREPRPKAGAPEWAAQNAGRILACTPASGDQLGQLLAQVGLEL